MKKKIFVANFKSNLPKDGVIKYLNCIKPYTKKVDIILLMPYTHLFLKKFYKNLIIGAQNFTESFVSATGEININMLKDLKIDTVLLGHSERRLKFNESLESVNKKLLLAIENNFKIILCIGEDEADYKNNSIETAIQKQVDFILKNVSDSSIKNIIFAYEPSWSIYPKNSADNNHINKYCEFLRKILSKKYPELEKQDFIIVYGGSVNNENIITVKETNTDGVLVGNASLDIQKTKCILKEQMK